MSDGGRPVIVVGIDGSDLSSAALHWALHQARLTGAEVKAVMSWELPRSVWIYLTPTSTEENYELRAEEVMDRVLKEAASDFGDVPVHRVIVGKSPGLALAEAAEGAQMLVVGSHGRGELPGLHLGSVAGYVVHHAPCPVLVFRGAHTGR